MSKKTQYICVNTLIGTDELEGRYTKRPGDTIELDSADKGTVRLLERGAIRLPTDAALPPVANTVPMENVDTSGDGAPVDPVADDGLGDDPTPDPVPKQDAVKQAAAKTAASSAGKKK